MAEAIKKYLPVIFFLALVLFFNIYFRASPIYFPQLKAQAKNYVEQKIRQGIAQEVYRKFPQFDPLAKDRLIKSKFAEYKRQNRKIIQEQILEGYRSLKDRYQDASGQTYLMELDCWHWARYVKNILRLGHPGDEVVYGRQRDTMMLAPVGFYMVWDHFLYYLSAFFYTIFSIFQTIPLNTFLFYLPLFYTAVFLTSLYCFSLRYADCFGAALTCLFVGLAPIAIERSFAGWFDKDIFNLLLPVLIVWTYLLAINADSLKRRLLWIFFSAFWVGLFAFTWTHWWFIFFIIIFYDVFSLLILIFIYFKAQDKDFTLCKQRLISLSFFVISSLFFILLIAKEDPLVELYKQIQFALVLNRPLMASIWPNVYATVGELRRPSISDLIASTGNGFLFGVALISFLSMLLKVCFKRENNFFKRQSIILFTIWLFAMIFACFRGARFVIFLLLPLGFFLGYAVNDLYRYFKRKYRITALVGLVLVMLVIASVSITRANMITKRLYPLIDDTWYKVLTLVREKTPSDTILNSWWDFGDWFKTVADRRVIFDGQSQHLPQAYWMGRVFLSQNEAEAIAILRMLNNGGNLAFEIIDGYFKDPLKSVLLLENALMKEPKQAEQVLAELLPPSLVRQVMILLFANPGRACFVVDNTLVPKMQAISFLGSWDFSKVYIVQNFRQKEKELILDYLQKVGRRPEVVQRLYQEVFLIEPKNLESWFSRRLQFFSPVFEGTENEGIVFFNNGFIYNPKEHVYVSNAGQIPLSLFALAEDNTNLAEYVYPKANQSFSVLVFKNEEGKYRSIFLERELGNSLFVRLYFLAAKGLRHFTPFVNSEEGNNYIRVFRIIW